MFLLIRSKSQELLNGQIMTMPANIDGGKMKDKQHLEGEKNKLY